MIPNVFAIVDNANHRVATIIGKERLEVVFFAGGVEAFVTRKYSVGEQAPVFVEEGANHVSIISGAKSANVKFVEGIDVFEEVKGAGPEAGVIPR